MLLQCLSDTAPVIEIIIIGYSISDSMVWYDRIWHWQQNINHNKLSCCHFCNLRDKICALLQTRWIKSETWRWVQRLGRGGHSRGHITGHIKLSKSTSMSFSRPVYTLYLLLLCRDSCNTSRKGRRCISRSGGLFTRNPANAKPREVVGASMFSGMTPPSVVIVADGVFLSFGCHTW